MRTLGSIGNGDSPWPTVATRIGKIGLQASWSANDHRCSFAWRKMSVVVIGADLLRSSRSELGYRSFISRGAVN